MMKLTLIAVSFIPAISLQGVAQELALVAGIVVSLGILSAGCRRFLRACRRTVTWMTGFARKVDEIWESTSGLREWREDVDGRLNEGSERFDRVDRLLETLSQSERAAVRGALEAVTTPIRPRPSRRTDPPPPGA